MTNSNGAFGAETPKDRERRHDLRLIERMAKGDETALTEFYRRHAAILYGMATKILNDSREAEVALQEGLIHIWQRAGSYQPQLGSPFSWAVMIVRHKAIDRMRVRQRGVRAVERASLQTELVAEVEEHSENEPALREFRVRASATLAQLPEDQREALELAFFRGLTHEEVAAQLGEPLGTVKARIRRGLLRMRILMSNHHD
jgi:RNA polymerase sigma-70 factor, ECF subfamily